MNAFVYVWSDQSTGKVYVGSHKGTPDDGYVCSSRLMKEEYAKRPADFTREIISVGLFDEMRKLEDAIIRGLDPRNNETTYNQCVTGPNWHFKQHSRKSRSKIAAAKTGKPRPDVSESNKMLSREEKFDRISRGHVTRKLNGHKNPMQGRKHSPEALAKMSAARKRYYEEKRNGN